MLSYDQHLVAEVERLAGGAQIHDVRDVIATYKNWFSVLEQVPDHEEEALKRINEYEDLLRAYVQMRKSGQYPSIYKMKEKFLSEVKGAMNMKGAINKAIEVLAEKTKVWTWADDDMEWRSVSINAYENIPARDVLALADSAGQVNYPSVFVKEKIVNGARVIRFKFEYNNIGFTVIGVPTRSEAEKAVKGAGWGYYLEGYESEQEAEENREQRKKDISESKMLRTLRTTKDWDFVESLIDQYANSFEAYSNLSFNENIPQEILLEWVDSVDDSNLGPVLGMLPFDEESFEELINEYKDDGKILARIASNPYLPSYVALELFNKYFNSRDVVYALLNEEPAFTLEQFEKIVNRYKNDKWMMNSVYFTLKDHYKKSPERDDIIERTEKLLKKWFRI
ncbi:MAG: hypothetical protein WC444_04715 [Candidatus Paceibacterota bacterium]